MLLLTGHVAVNLTVRDPARSRDWYVRVLHMELLYQYPDSDSEIEIACLAVPNTSFVLGLNRHAGANDQRFDESRIGLDHLEFLVEQRDDLDKWAARLDELGVGHSGVKEPSYTRNAMVTFRDPDNIQLEFFWSAASPN